jgi:hypothetical protein
MEKNMDSKISRKPLDFILQEGEILKPIKGFKNFVISNYGRIKNTKTGKEIKTWVNKGSGYVCSMLCEDTKRKNVRVHILVASAFIPNPLNKKTVNHDDGDKLNNHSSNLGWNTQSENQLHAYRTGLQVAKKGVDGNTSKANSETVKAVKRLLAKGYDSTYIKQNVDLSAFASPNAFISRIRLNKAYLNE